MRAALAKYTKIFAVGAQNTFVYRWNFVLRSVFGIVPLIGTIFLWRAMYGSTGGTTLSGYTYSSLILYFAMTVLVENLVTPTEDEWQIAGEIRDGKISFLLLKPMNYIAYRFTLYASYRLLYVLIVLPGIALVFYCLRGHFTFPGDPMNSTWNRARPVRTQFARTHSQGNPRNVVRDRGSTTPRWRTGFWIGIDRCKPNSMAIGQRPHPGCVWAADPDPDRPDASTRPPPEVPIQFPGPGRMDPQVRVRGATMAILENPDPIF